MLSLRSVSGSNSSRGIAAVVGVGPRLGSAVARKFASEGYTIAILSRDLGTSSLPSSLSLSIGAQS
jgi:NAD(P)-dependent dehydrogenase (short-subunit alcohol dehydrogenase family)